MAAHGTSGDARGARLVLPNGFTLANLFFGIFAIVSASRGEFNEAARYTVFGAIADSLDGRVARATRSGSRFGSELDSLVDAISFGLAPALMMYFSQLNQTRWDWIFVFLFCACAVIRLARFNVEQAGRAKTHFTGLPSPAAGMALATYYWFSQTRLFNNTVIGDLPWHQMLPWVMLGLGMLMISNVPYAAVPTVGYRSIKGILGSLLVIGTVIGVLFLPKQFFFPALMGYVLFGLGKAVLLGLVERLPGREDDEERPLRSRRAPTALAPGDSNTIDLAAHAHAMRGRRRRRRPRGDRPSDIERPPESGTR
ncbi:MAG: CDP-diacylglycerol--serine O-phosphatidyltransferase [Gemmatimonadaceae bacterium]|jgi:CDP-diacylglycerol--serine O-phosphatidyltransferase|nr:CDP-diacylglycerol--serine O-phosphatidyltransferase [Gemmatimonadaceae bacterium]